MNVLWVRNMVFECEYCEKVFKKTAHLKRHQACVHDIGVTWFHCDQCDYKCKIESNLKKHKSNVHETNVTWYYCDQCEYKSKKKEHIKRHKEKIHDGSEWYECKHCDYKTKSEDMIKRHKPKHKNLIVKPEWYKCDIINCNYKSKIEKNLKRHKKKTHEIGLEWFYCDQENCESKFKSNGHLQRHKRNVHNIKVEYFYCNQENCNFKAKERNNLRQHKAYIHDIAVKWYYCDFPMCDYKCKFNSSLKKHFKCMHTTEGQAKQKKEEQKIARLLEKNNIKVERETRINFDCFDSGKNYAFIDFVIYRKDCVILLEVDENQHKYGYTIPCDMKRMSHVLTAIRAQGNNQTVLFLRYNPHNFKKDYYTPEKLNQKERQKELINFINSYVPKIKEGLEIKYMYYDEENGRPSVSLSDEYNPQMKECVI